MALIDDIVSKKELQSVPVPEWDIDVYFYPFVLSDSDYAAKMSKGNDGEFVAYTIIRKAMDENGKPLFNLKDKTKLMHGVDSDVLSKLVIDMKGGDDDDEDNQDAGKP